jgi:hypothetical protein
LIAKEYPKGQAVYSLTFDQQETDLEPPDMTLEEAGCLSGEGLLR